MTSTSLCLAICCQVLGAVVTGCKSQQKVPPAIFMFGDGTLDVSNNNHLNYTDDWGEPNRANHPYYGIDFPNSEPTGRFSNGYNIADFIAMAMGLEISPPAYLSLTSPISVKDFTGVNYASEGGRIWNYSILVDDSEVTIPLLTQLDYFADTKAQMAPQLGNHQLRKLLSKSLFLISVGREEVCRVINIPPIGCAPEMRGKAVGRRSHQFGPGGCDETVNELAVEFNDGLKRLLYSLSSKLDGLRYSIGDFYSFSNGTFANPGASGFANTSIACCKRPCDSQAAFQEPPCQNRAEYWFWDEEYITEKAAKLAAAAFYDGPSKFTMPINFKKLVQRK
ncbi:unnamed protein product [Urochloa decumbens]|uniref:GDSL esterase/lipase n=1 Tax=Urochloa decumbens TaxID=240449 RepID=A0ABC8ZZT7_9POAL